MVKRGKFYRVSDYIPANQLKALGIALMFDAEFCFNRWFYDGMPLARNRVMATPTGEKRQPRRGEWYLSGAVVEAYRAQSDLHGVFHIARLAVVEETTSIKEIS